MIAKGGLPSAKGAKSFMDSKVAKGTKFEFQKGPLKDSAKAKIQAEVRKLKGMAEKRTAELAEGIVNNVTGSSIGSVVLAVPNVLVDLKNGKLKAKTVTKALGSITKTAITSAVPFMGVLKTADNVCGAYTKIKKGKYVGRGVAAVSEALS